MSILLTRTLETLLLPPGGPLLLAAAGVALSWRGWLHARWLAAAGLALAAVAVPSAAVELAPDAAAGARAAAEGRALYRPQLGYPMKAYVVSAVKDAKAIVPAD